MDEVWVSGSTDNINCARQDLPLHWGSDQRQLTLSAHGRDSGQENTKYDSDNGGRQDEAMDVDG